MDVLLAVDIGTSRTRARLFSLTGEPLDEASRPARSEFGSEGRAELDHDMLWTDVCEVIRQLTTPSLSVRALGVTAQLGMLLIDAEGSAIGKAILWADTRAQAEAEELAITIGDLCPKIGGRRLTPELMAPRLAWLQRHRPDMLSRAARVVSLKDYVVLRLSGRVAIDETHASYSGLFDVDRRSWSDELVRLTGCDRKLLPDVAPAGTFAGNLTTAAGGLLGIESPVPVCIGTSDGTAGTIGAGAVSADITVDVAGTTDTILHTVSIPMRDTEGALVVNAHAVPGLWTVGGPTGYTGGAVAWMARVLGHADQHQAAALSNAVASIPPGCDGLRFYPALTGSRFPDWNSSERGGVRGLNANHGPGHLLRAAQEGAAFVVADALDTFRRCGLAIAEVIVVGGLASQPSALQLRCDILGVPVATLATEESSSVGIAMLAGVSAGIFADVGAAAAVFVRRGRRFEPDGAIAKRLALARTDWRALR